MLQEKLDKYVGRNFCMTGYNVAYTAYAMRDEDIVYSGLDEALDVTNLTGKLIETADGLKMFRIDLNDGTASTIRAHFSVDRTNTSCPFRNLSNAIENAVRDGFTQIIITNSHDFMRL